MTFQFKTEVDGDGGLVNMLYIYNWFISTYRYQLKDEVIAIDFESSSLRTPGCPVEQIREIKKLVNVVHSFSIRFDQLTLYDLASR